MRSGVAGRPGPAHRGVAEAPLALRCYTAFREATPHGGLTPPGSARALPGGGAGGPARRARTDIHWHFGHALRYHAAGDACLSRGRVSRASCQNRQQEWGRPCRALQIHTRKLDNELVWEGRRRCAGCDFTGPQLPDRRWRVLLGSGPLEKCLWETPCDGPLWTPCRGVAEAGRRRCAATGEAGDGPMKRGSLDPVGFLCFCEHGHGCKFGCWLVWVVMGMSKSTKACMQSFDGNLPPSHHRIRKGTPQRDRASRRKRSPSVRRTRAAPPDRF